MSGGSGTDAANGCVLVCIVRARCKISCQDLDICLLIVTLVEKLAFFGNTVSLNIAVSMDAGVP